MEFHLIQLFLDVNSILFVFYPANKEKHFIEDEIFEQLLKVREEICQKTEINVSPRKLVNMLLKQSDFEVLRDQLIQQYL